jgi:ABC-type polysaccharide/polyol phosphate transport system ATPase subunit
MEFQAKCREFLKDYKRRGRTLVVVSHDMRSLESICDVGMCLSQGRTVSAGTIGDVIGAYTAIIHDHTNTTRSVTG